MVFILTIFYRFVKLFKISLFEPVFAIEEDEHKKAQERHERDDDIEAIRPFNKRHVAGIHTKDSGEEGERESDDRDDSEGLHDVVELAVDQGFVGGV